MTESSQHYSAARLVKRLFSYVSRWWYLFVVSFLGYGLYAASQMAFAQWMEQIINSLESGQLENRTLIAAMVVGIFLIRGVGAFTGQYSIAWVARRLVHQVRTQLFDTMLRLPVSDTQQQSDGQLLSKLSYNVEQVTGAVTDALRTLLREGLTVVGLAGYLIYLNWKLTLVILAAAPFIALTVYIAARRFRTLAHRIQHSVGEVTQVTADTVRGYEVIRIFGTQPAQQQRFEQASEHNRQQYMKMVVAQAINTPAVQLLVSAAMAVLVYLAMSPTLLADMSTGEFIAFLTAAGMIAKPLRQITEINSILQKGLAAAQSIFELIDQPGEPDKGQQLPDPVTGEITLTDLSFNYPNSDTAVLNNLTLTIPAGKTVALVGRSGSGKSTLASLLPRFYDPQQGSICLDGTPLQQIPLTQLRQQMALVSQQVVLFSGTIAENIAYGELADASREAIEAAAVAAHVTEFSDHLPEGLDTRLGDGGIQLSGGQRQRIAIARAILKDAPILILDEATSALDNTSERHIQAALKPLMANRTALVIAHRLSTIEHADLIVVLDQGQIIEQGDHNTLLANQGAYARLHQMQFNEPTEPDA